MSYIVSWGEGCTEVIEDKEAAINFAKGLTTGFAGSDAGYGDGYVVINDEEGVEIWRGEVA